MGFAENEIVLTSASLVKMNYLKKYFYLYNFKQLKLSGNPNRLMMKNWRMKFDLGVKCHLNLFLITGIQISRSPSKWHTTVELYLLLFFLHGNHNVIISTFFLTYSVLLFLPQMKYHYNSFQI